MYGILTYIYIVDLYGKFERTARLKLTYPFCELQFAGSQIVSSMLK